MAKYPSVARFLVSGDEPPKLTVALPLAERIHLALVELSNGSSMFTGCDSAHRPLKGHEHAYIFCESNQGLGRGNEGEITHVTVYSSTGFCSHDQKALQKLEHVYDGSVIDIHLSLLGMGQPEDFGGTDLQVGQCPLLAKSRTWISRLPFVPTRHPKVTRAGASKLDATGLQIDSPEHELRRLLKLGGFPVPAMIERVPCTRLGEKEVFWSNFQSERNDSSRGIKASSRKTYGFRIHFPEPVQGPLSEGYAAHFGMGSFVAEDNGIIKAIKEDPSARASLPRKGDIQIGLLEARIRFLTQAHIPLWAGNGFRVGMGNKLIDRVCAVYIHNPKEPSKELNERRHCRKSCQLAKCCSYGSLFRSFSLEGQKDSLGSFEAPLPLILTPPATGSYSPNDCATVGFAMIGSALDTLPYLFLALRDLGKSGLGQDRHIGGGRFDLELAYSLSPQERKQVYYNGNLQSSISTFSYLDLLGQAEKFDGSITLRFITPTHIGDWCGYSSRPSFGMLLGHLLMRSNMLSSSHGTGYLYGPEECKDMLEKAEKMEQVSAFVDEVHLHRQNYGQDGQGDSQWRPPHFLGEIVYRGSFSKDIMALLSLGQIVNVGKGASIGNGMFRMEKSP